MKCSNVWATILAKHHGLGKKCTFWFKYIFSIFTLYRSLYFWKFHLEIKCSNDCATMLAKCGLVYNSQYVIVFIHFSENYETELNSFFSVIFYVSRDRYEPYNILTFQLKMECFNAWATMLAKCVLYYVIVLAHFS